MAFDDRICTLGEGPLWHPTRASFFWFDIIGKRLLTPGAEWPFSEHVSAAGWVDHNTLLIASETQLMTFDLETGQKERVSALEADNPDTRSNDGRADPQGGFWIGTMGKAAEDDRKGAYYRYYRGELRQLWDKVSIPNATCFAPDGKTAYFTDTPRRQIMRVALDPLGWPTGTPKVHVDLTAEALNPDGAVVSQDGILWVALWGAGRVDGFDTKGNRVASFDVPAVQPTCPAFGGAEMSDMLVTSAAEGLSSQALAQAPQSGCTFLLQTDSVGQPEHQVIL